MKNFTPQAVIFDMDGTLVDTEKVWAEAEGAMLTARGFVYTKEIRDQVLGLRLDEFFTKLRVIMGIEESVESLSNELNARMTAIIPTRTVPMPGAAELVAWTVEQGLPRAIASSSAAVIIQAVIDSQGWHDAIPLYVSADTVPRGKPAPDVYLRTAELLGVDPSVCLAVEDSPVGARAAVAAGMVCAAVCDPAHTLPEEFADITPYVYQDLHQVLRDLRDR